MSNKPDSIVKNKPQQVQREARRAAAMRDNLRKRKTQAEARRTAGQPQGAK